MKKRMGERDGTGANRTAITSLNVAVKAWPTPVAADSGEKVTLTTTQGACLLREAAQWATPMARDSFPPHTPEYVAAKKAQGHGMRNLNDEAAHWSTPSVADTEGGRKARSGPRSDELLLNGQAIALSSPQDPETPTPGEPSSSAGRKLNPLFVEWLMGWPPGWTLLCSTGSTDCGSWGMASSAWWQGMRSELSRLVSPPAPPAQLSLFA
jgi:hypothetical protein